MPDYFRLRFTIEGVSELSRILGVTHRKLSNFKKPLWESARLILADVEQQFRSEGGLTGGWKKLTDSTVAGRIRAGYGGKHPILQRTGALRKSFVSHVDSRRMVVTSRGVPYYAYHQSKMPRRYPPKGLPRRTMLLLTQRTKENIQEKFNKFLRFK